MTRAPKVESLLVELAGMRCPRLGDDVHRSAKIFPTDPEPCPVCHGSTYLLDASVRVPCPCESEPGYHTQSIPPLDCADRGWTPSRDYFVWECAFVALKLQVNRFAPGPVLVIGTVNGGREIPDKAEAVLTALAQR